MIVDDELRRLTTLIYGWRADGRLSLRATVPGDLNPSNQLFDDAQLVAVIDTDDCRVEPLVWEVAQTVYGDRGLRAGADGSRLDRSHDRPRQLTTSRHSRDGDHAA